MDVSDFASYYLKKKKLKIKVTKWGTPKKYFKKDLNQLLVCIYLITVSLL
jgi:hypothetical protein